MQVTTESEFKEKWNNLKKELEESKDSIANMQIYSHGGYLDATAGQLYFVPDGQNDGTLTYDEILSLSNLPFDEDAFIDLYACNSGTGGNRSTAKAFANSQNVFSSGSTGKSYFSQSKDHHKRINSFSPQVYLEAFDRRENKKKNDNSALGRAYFTSDLRKKGK